MKVEDLILISIDDHVLEPPNLFEGRLPLRYQDRAPRVERREHQGREIDVWVFEDEVKILESSLAVAGRVKEEFGYDPISYDEMRPGHYDVHERVRDLSAVGVLASTCFPSFPQFCGQLFSRADDKDLALAVIQAYNDWQIEDWCGAYPGRFIPNGLVPLWDPTLAAVEIKRIAAKDCHAISFSENPEKLGYPSIYQMEHWHPLWSAACDVSTVVNMHIGTSSSITVTSVDAPVDVVNHVTPLNALLAGSDLLWSPVLRTYGPLKIALSEGGAGWVPWFLERADYVYRQQHAWTGQNFGDKLPSEVFKEHVITCFIHDSVAVRNRDLIGIDNVCWEFDYPHSDCSWPDAPEVTMEYLKPLSDEDINKITHENAIRTYHLDPFAHRPKRRCTVGALRAEAPDVDFSLRSHGLRNTSGQNVALLAAAFGSSKNAY